MREEEHFRLMVQNAREYAIFSVDLDGRISTWNSGAERLLGYSREEIVGRLGRVIFTPEDVASGRPETERAVAAEKGQADDETWHVRKDGTRFWAAGIMHSVRDDTGRLQGFVKVLRDDTERVRAAALIEESEERFRSLVEEVPGFAILMLGPEGNVVSWNAGAQKLLGYAADEAMGRPHSLLLRAGGPAEERPGPELGEARAKGRWNGEGWIPRKDGSRFWGEVTLTPMRSAIDGIKGFTAIFRDLTVEKAAEDARTEHLAYLEAMDAFTMVLAQDLDLETVLRKALEKLLDLFRAERAYLMHPLHPGGDEFRVPFLAEQAGCGPRPIGAGKLEDEFHCELARAILASRVPLDLGPESAFPGYRECRSLFGTGPLLAVALRPKRGTSWALVLHRCEGAEAWSGGEFRLFGDLADRMTAVLDNLLLFRDLKSSEWRFRWLVENTAEVVWRFDLKAPMPESLPEDEQVGCFFRDGYLAECNDAMARNYGYASAAEIIGKPLAELMPPSEPANAEYLRVFIRSDYRLLDAESLEVDREGNRRYVLNNLVAIRENGRVTGAWGTSRDITDRRLAELELRKSRDQLEAILRRISDAILVYDGKGDLVYLNDSASRMFGLSAKGDAGIDEAVGMQEIHAGLAVLDEEGRPMPPERMPSRQALSGAEAGPTLMRHRFGPDREERWLMVRSNPLLDEDGRVRMVITIAQDVTELRRTEEQFRQAQKMEAVGLLAGGVAHEFNNLLTAINGYAELLLASTPPEDPRKPQLEEIRAAGSRAASLTNQLLVHSRRHIVSRRIFDLNGILSDMEELLRKMLGGDILLQVRLDARPLPVKADRGQIEQVVLNLASNARDAMPEGGRLVIRSALLEGRREPPGGESAIPRESHALLEFSDTGHGFDEAVRGRIFEPFFTTKGFGQASGLGLSTAYGIVKQSGGDISVESAPGKGAAFRIRLPLHRREAAVVASAAGEGGENPARGARTILVAEDDEAIRALVLGILRAEGHRVLEAADGQDALQAFESAGGGIDLLITDVVMPRMGGRELADRLRGALSASRIIFMSGYVDDQVGKDRMTGEAAAFLQKPFSPKALVGVVRTALGTVHAPGS